MVKFWLSSVAVAIAFAAAGCRVQQPSQLPADARWLVAVKSAPLSTPFFAHHAYLDLVRDGVPERLESYGRLGIGHGALDADELRCNQRFDDRAVRVLGWIDGDDARVAIARIDAALLAMQGDWPGCYTKWPGPNSNTFVRELLADVPELGFVFDPNCIGKDFTWFDVAWTASKTGLRVDTPVLGAAVGLREGVELHLLQLTFGISLDPPGLSIPFLPQIPFGLFGPKPVALVPDVRAGDLSFVVDEAVCDGQPRALGTIAVPGRVLWSVPDQQEWLEVAAGAEQPGPVPLSHQVTYEVRRHAQDGVSHSTEGAVHYGERPVSVRTQAAGRVVLFEMVRLADGRLQVAARAFRDLAHEAAAADAAAR